jgi:hypothetical protein
MNRLLTAVLASGVAISACAPATQTATPAQPAPQPAAPPADASHIPTGTHFSVTLEEELNTSNTRVGDSFIVVVNEALVAANGQVVVPAGARIQGMVTGVAQPGGRDPAALRLNFLRINVNDAWHPLTAEIVGTHVPMDGRTDHTQHAQAAVTGAVAGAIIGGVITGRLREALIGAAIGAGAGTIISLGVGGPMEAALPAGTHMTLRTADRISLR